MGQNGKILKCKIIQGDCLTHLSKEFISEQIDLTFLDPPFNQDKEYASWNDNLPEHKYWQIMGQVCKAVYGITSDGGQSILCRESKY